VPDKVVLIFFKFSSPFAGKIRNNLALVCTQSRGCCGGEKGGGGSLGRGVTSDRRAQLSCCYSHVTATNGPVTVCVCFGVPGVACMHSDVKKYALTERYISRE
jgi:hypothetical protein